MVIMSKISTSVQEGEFDSNVPQEKVGKLVIMVNDQLVVYYYFHNVCAIFFSFFIYFIHYFKIIVTFDHLNLLLVIKPF